MKELGIYYLFRIILTELETHRNALQDAEKSLNEIKNEENDIKNALKIKYDELSRLQEEITNLENTCSTIHNNVDINISKKNYESNAIIETCFYGIFEVCGYKILSYLHADDLLNLYYYFII